jgi:tRNA-Thr(GGU) m(6)t(6)A37 methyltransferase TsaA
MFLKDNGQVQVTMEKFNAAPVGYVRSEIVHRAQAPRQGRDASSRAWIEILSQYREALVGIEQWSQLLVICWMHLAERDTLVVRPRGDVREPLTGVFATRSPARPNPVSVYTVELYSIEGTMLYVGGIDAVDGTPVLDIKPHVHRLDD